MTARWLVGAALGGVALAGCDPLPRPDYVDVKYPASYRTEPGGVRVDNGGYKLDAQGYRVVPQGERVGMIHLPEKTAGDKSNAVAGYYISNRGAIAPGRLATTNAGVAPSTPDRSEAGPAAHNLDDARYRFHCCRLSITSTCTPPH